ncbi:MULTISPECIES: hypothetical protein [unclassified Streptomyces]|uniref:hypothetical protein n=1 Tax=unclassified Streptomyces TaxID=2593676 RepID=UPI002441C1B9|nr:hypothetical protein [Streptomyces sp. DH41]MDG9723733.1 hypothetical protein [Streptomyces sp. DH41]
MSSGTDGHWPPRSDPPAGARIPRGHRRAFAWLSGSRGGYAKSYGAQSVIRR